MCSSRWKKDPDQKYIKVNKNILFICGGAFDGIEHIKKNEYKCTGVWKGIDEQIDDGNLLQYVSQDVKSFGIIPELIGDFVVTHLDPLDRYAWNILTEPKNSIIKQYRKLLRLIILYSR